MGKNIKPINPSFSSESKIITKAGTETEIFQFFQYLNLIVLPKL